MKKLFSLLLLVVAFPFLGTAQFGPTNCVPVTPSNVSICPGDSVLVQFNPPVGTAGQQFNFNFGSLPNGWFTEGTSSYGQPCLPGIDGTAYYWAASAGGTTPQIVSPGFNLICGGTIDFDMVMAVQSGSTPCEGPDLANEGIELQYSLDNGGTWTTIIYYSPGGFTLPTMPASSSSVASGTTPYTSWNSFSVPIPLAAMTPNTMIRWVQQNSSGTCCDNWGIDNIFVNTDPCQGVVVDWTLGIASDDTTSFYYTPTQDTAFVAVIYDSTAFANGILDTLCWTDSVFINVYQNDISYDLTDTVFAYCPYDTIPESVTNVQGGLAPYDYQWSNGSLTANTLLGAGGAEQSQTTFYVDVSDGCGFVVTDSIVLDVNQTLSIDSFFVQNANACTPTGAASAFYSGDSTTQQNGLVWYFEGPGQPGANQVAASVITNVPSGWYYVTLTDAVCSVTDSVYIDIDEPPVAQFSPGSANGCAPVDVSFVNSSQNTTNYVWDFGDGSPTVNSTDASHSFTQTSTVMLIASDNSGCSDTAYAQIDVVPCGCTDPSALNYNAFATFDDGSCIFPDPIVIPANVFTPDGDNTNDLFYLETINVEEMTLIITNRWGNLMYSGTGPNPAWDGTNQGGADAEEGVYFYKYTATGVIPDQVVEGHGFVHLERK